MKNIEDLQRYDMIDYDCFGKDADGDFVDYEEAKEIVEQYEKELRDKDALIVELSKDLEYLRELACGNSEPMGVIKTMIEKINK